VVVIRGDGGRQLAATYGPGRRIRHLLGLGFDYVGEHGPWKGRCGLLAEECHAQTQRPHRQEAQ